MKEKLAEAQALADAQQREAQMQTAPKGERRGRGGSRDGAAETSAPRNGRAKKGRKKKSRRGEPRRGSRDRQGASLSAADSYSAARPRETRPEGRGIPDAGHSPPTARSTTSATLLVRLSPWAPLCGFVGL